MLRWLIGAMMGGVAVFALASLALASRVSPDEDTQLARILLAALVLLGVGELMAYSLIRRAAIRGRGPGPASSAQAPAEPLPAFRSLTIVAAAMAEGFALFGIVIHLTTRAPLGLAAAAAGLLVLWRLLTVESRFARFAAERRGGTS